MIDQELAEWELRFEAELRMRPAFGLSHDISHIKRVRRNAIYLGGKEDANLAIVLPAAWFHDCIMFDKNSLDRGRSSILSAMEARSILERICYPSELGDEIAHAIEAHSYSGAIEPKTIEAKVLRDADRLDALGAVGVARCFLVGSKFAQGIYSEEDFFCTNRMPDDKEYIVDHFFIKLMKLHEGMCTDTGRSEAIKRTDFMKQFLTQLAQESGIISKSSD